MRLTLHTSALLLSAAYLLNPAVSSAAPITGGTGPGGFELANGASGLQLWLRGDVGVTTSGGLVTTWEDQSGYNRDVSQGNVAVQPTTNNRNALNVVDFAVGQNRLEVAAFSAGFTSGQLFMALRADQDSGGAFGAPLNIGTNSNHHHPWSDGVIYDNFGTNSRHSTGGAAANLADWHVYNVLASNPTWTSRINGTQQFTTNSNNTAGGFNTFGGNPNFTIGTEQATYNWTGEIGDFVLYDRTLNATEQTITENHYSSKYDIAINALVDHYAGDTGGAGNFDYGVFGVGNESGTSVLNAGHDGLGIQIGSAASGDWVFAGHTNGLNGTTSSDMPGGQRWERSWFIDTTNIGTADLAFDWSDAGVTTAFDPLFNGLYYRQLNSGLFTLVAAGVVDTVNGRVDFSGVSLPNTDGYFTLGTIPVPEPSTLTLLGLGCVGMAVRRKRRSVKSEE